MNYKKKKLLTLFVSVLGLIAAFILTSPNTVGLCSSGDIFCFDPYDELIGQPLGIFSVCVFVISLILLIVHDQIFETWSKFSLIVLPILVILIAVTPAVKSNPISFDKEMTTLSLAAVYFILSILIIIFKSLKLRRGEN